MRRLFSRPWFLPALMVIVGVLFLYWGLLGRGLLNYAAALILFFVAFRFLGTTRMASG